jgi:hypothetical protein
MWRKVHGNTVDIGEPVERADLVVRRARRGKRK